MGVCLELLGNRFGSLTVIKKHVKNKHNQMQWICLCDCGKETIVMANSLTSGNTKSCGCKSYLHRYKKGDNLEDLTNMRFGRWFVIGRAESSKSKQTMWLCKCDCGKERKVGSETLKNKASVSCGCYHKELLKLRVGERAANWKGGKRKAKNGYVFLFLPDYPFSSDGYVSEHRFVMEGYLGRYLHKDEMIHHKNGIRMDNRIENLELWIKNHPTGQRVEDMVVWAKELLEKYDPDSLVKEQPKLYLVEGC